MSALDLITVGRSFIGGYSHSVTRLKIKQNKKKRERERERVASYSFIAKVDKELNCWDRAFPELSLRNAWHRRKNNALSLVANNFTAERLRSKTIYSPTTSL
jgi:hypothetical protein